MLTIQSMQVGKKYLVGDSLGFDAVECIEVNPPKEMERLESVGKLGVGVKVRYLETGTEDFFFEFVNWIIVKELSE